MNWFPMNVQIEMIWTISELDERYPKLSAVHYPSLNPKYIELMNEYWKRIASNRLTQIKKDNSADQIKNF